MPTLVSLSGLPGVGKTTIARHLCPMLGGFHLRVDTIETSLKTGPLKVEKLDAVGYLIAAEVAKDNLRLGLDVVADRPGVGANLQDHLEVYFQLAAKQPITLYKH